MTRIHIATRFLLSLGMALAGLAPNSAGAQRIVAAAHVRQFAVRADDGHRLVVWSRRPARPRGAILLLHGRTWSALPNFDLQVPNQHLSLMDAFAARGYAVYALDQRGYGATARDSSQWLTPERAARDANEVLAWIRTREHLPVAPALLGYSQGSRTAMLAAIRDSTRMSALVLYGFPQSTSAEVRAQLATLPDPATPERRATTIAAAEEDFMSPESTLPGVKAAYGRAAVAADPVRSDWRGERQFAMLDPAALRVPVILINGERDPYAARADLGGFMSRVSGVDRSWVVLARSDHAAHLERQREFADAVAAFLDRVDSHRSAR